MERFRRLGWAGSGSSHTYKHGKQWCVCKIQMGVKPRGSRLGTKSNLAGQLSVPTREGGCLSGIQMLRKNEAVWRLVQVP